MVFTTKLFISIILLFSSALQARELSRTQVIMGTYITITADEKNHKDIQSAFNILKDIDNHISSYNPTTTVYKLNKNIKTPLDKYTKEALSLSKKYYKISNGYFDISTNLFKQGKKIDFGGMGKGYGVDKVSEFFVSQNILSATIAASGDIRCLGICPIEVNNPFSDKSLATFRTKHKNQGVSTSGNYNNFIESVENNHLINPKTKKSQNNFVSITLIGTIKSSDLDAYATAASVMPKDEAYKFLDSLKLAYIILESSRELKVSENIKNYTEDLLINYTQKENKEYINN